MKEICPKCKKEFEIVELFDGKCPSCELLYFWDELPIFENEEDEKPVRWEQGIQWEKYKEK